MNRFIIILLAVLAVTMPAAHADTPAAINACHAITDRSKRLECFDAIPGPVSSAEIHPPVPVPSNLSWTGTGGSNVRPFNVDGPWTIHWSAGGSYFGIYVYTADGQIVGVAANQPGAGDGSSYQPKRGAYYLSVNAVGRWRIWVTPE